ncbi:DoxX-like family protein [Chryseobacterium lathyri]|uniref:DoxX-like family protein n=1 Tax=Chryseobacterium lathyri TaxID=395933 RepID=UPI001CC0262C|nr:DoxX-like family protein [Chryseobacterium lathyri]
MKSIYNIVIYSIATVWMINGLFCKVLNLVPRHEEIVARILGGNYSRILTLLIGCSEILMAIWILTGINSRFNAIAQIVIIAAMNMLEFILAPDLLLWGRFNSLFAFLFIVLIYFNEFHLNPKN